MEKLEIIKLDKVLTYEIIRDIILDNELTEDDTILLHPQNLDNIILRYRNTYGSGMQFSHELLGVNIDSSVEYRISLAQIGILRKY